MLTEEQNIAIRSLARESFSNYCLAVDKNYELAWFHKELCRKLQDVAEGRIKRLMVFMPPRHGKSELCSIKFPAWFMGKYPERKVIASSYNSELATNFGRKVRNLCKENSHKYIFDEFEMAQDSSSSHHFNTKQGGTYLAVGVGGTTTGFGSDVFLIDDPIKNREEADSETYRNKVWDWYSSTAYTRLEGLGAIVLILTRWHEDDLAGRLLKAQEEGGDRWEIVNYPAIATEPEENRNVGEALWKQRYDEKKLEQIKNAMIPRDWYALFQQTPSGEAAQEFYREWFRYWDSLPEGLEFLTVVDPAFKKKATSDYSVVMTVGVKGNKRYIIEYTRGRYSPDELITNIMQHLKKWKPRSVGVEAYAAQTVIGFYLQEKMKEEQVFVQYQEIVQKGDKQTKIRRLINPWRDGKIYHHRSMLDLESELLAFPVGAHDDIIDCVQMIEEFKITEINPFSEQSYFDKLGITYNGDYEPRYNEYGEPI